MRQLIYILIFIGLTKYSYSQTYSAIVSDSIIENFIVWEIDNTDKYYYDQKLWKKRIEERIIHWEEALIDHILSQAYIPNSFENQFEIMIMQDKNYSRNSNKVLKSIPELFDKKDVEYLKMQFENTQRNIVWEFNSKKSNLKKKPKNKYYTYSIPLFNKSHTIAILYKVFYCGSLCASGDLNIYVKESGKWKLYKSIGCWMS